MIPKGRATRQSKPRMVPRWNANGSSSATSGRGAGRSISAWLSTSSHRATRSRSALATGASARPASGCRPIARANSNFTCSPIRSRPTIMCRCRKAQRSRSCPVRQCTGTPCCRRWSAPVSPFALPLRPTINGAIRQTASRRSCALRAPCRCGDCRKRFNARPEYSPRSSTA